MTGAQWPSRVDLEQASAAYEAGWWRTDPGVAAAAAADDDLRAHLAAGPPLVRTSDVYESAGWTARADLHRTLAAAQIAPGSPEPHPSAFFTIGCMGAGKTRMLGPLANAYRAVVLGRTSQPSRVAADAVRVALPEYGHGLGSRVVEGEAFTITYGQVFPAARDSRRDIVYDTIGRMLPSGQAGFETNLRELRAAGFGIHVLLVNTPFAMCVERAEQRALHEDGRLVRLADQQAVYDHPGRCLRRLEAEPGLVDDWIMVDGSGPPDAPPMQDGNGAWASRYQDLLDQLSGSTSGPA